ncbi:hypothetical protein CR513_55491, partial [Mucuna pruriens]
MAEGPSTPSPALAVPVKRYQDWVSKEVLSYRSKVSPSKVVKGENEFASNMLISSLWFHVLRRRECAMLPRFGGHPPLGYLCGRCSTNAGGGFVTASSQWVGSATSIQGGVPSACGATNNSSLSKPLHCPSWQKGWLGVPCPLPKTSLFSAYTISYKGFKSRFIKIRAIDGGLFCADSRPLPLYWREPLKFGGLLRSQLSLKVRVNLQLLDELPRRMNCKEIVAWVSESSATHYLKSEFYSRFIFLARPSADFADYP